MNAPPENLKPRSIHLAKLQRLQNKIPRTTGNFPKPTQFENRTCFSNYCKNKESYKIITTQMFLTGQDKARPTKQTQWRSSLQKQKCPSTSHSTTK